jgi:hypothetical protein
VRVQFITIQIKLKHGGAGGEREESVHSVLVTGGPSEEPITVVKGRLNHTVVASLPPSVFTNVSMQNRFLSSPYTSSLSSPFTGHGASPPLFMLAPSGEEEVGRSSVSKSRATN